MVEHKTLVDLILGDSDYFNMNQLILLKFININLLKTLFRILGIYFFISLDFEFMNLADTGCQTYGLWSDYLFIF